MARSSVAVGPARFEGRAMGSPLRLTFGTAAPAPTGPPAPMALPPPDPHDCWRSVLDEFELAETAMSRFRDTSELTTLNRSAGSGIPARPSRRLRQALVAADRAHRITAGRFDPRVLVDLDRLGYRGAALGDPVDEAWDAAADDDGHAVDAGRRVVGLAGCDGLGVTRPIDLGGIGKGLTLRWTTHRLERLGARSFLLEAGGDLVARGHDPDNGPWLVGIEDPAGGDDLAVMAVADLAVATSSILVNRWRVDGRVVHHLLDPSTGEPVDRGLVAVTVAGPDPAWAEVWSKVLFVGGRDAIAAEARERGLAAWWIADDGTLEMTATARAMTIWVASEAA